MPQFTRQWINNPAHLSKLLALGMETLEQVQAAAQVAGPELSRFLDANVDEILASIPIAMESIPVAQMETIRNAPYELGVDIDHIPRLDFAPTFAIMAESAAAASCADHVAAMPPIRNQAARGTCVAHAALSAMEHWLASNGGMQDMSEQFLYWNCKTNDGYPNASGTWLGVAFPLLQRDGCCLESDWPYNPNVIIGNESQAPTPNGVQALALGSRIPAVRTISPTSVADIRAELTSGRVVAFSVPVFNSWHRSTAVAFSGDITMPIPGEIRTGGHAMCIVGCVDLPDKPALGGGRFILRNSWGAAWGINSPYGSGYGTIPFAYIARFGSEAYAVA